MNTAESKYIENKAYLSRCAREWALILRESGTRQALEFGREEDWLRCVKGDFPKYIPFLTENCGLEFRGRILEIGAGGAWLSAELSKQPRVVEVIATDASPKLLKEQAPKVFKMLNANAAKITRMPGDFHNLDFPNNYFDFVVCSAVLHRAANIVQALREAKRVLKPGGQFVAIREPVWPLVKIKSRAKMLAKLIATGVNERFYTLADYKEFFKQAAMPLQVKRVNLSSGFKYYVNNLVNGLTHARYAFVGTKRGRTIAGSRPAARAGSTKTDLSDSI
jgi:ubiquinone/menaquinone biosynthesis C-methylase UbiE